MVILLILEYSCNIIYSYLVALYSFNIYGNKHCLIIISKHCYISTPLSVKNQLLPWITILNKKCINVILSHIYV